VLVVLVVVGVVIAGDGSKGEPDAGTAPTAAAPQTSGRRVENRAIGASIARPTRWTVRNGKAIELRDPDGATAVSVSSPARTDRSAAVLRAAVEGVRADYEDVQVTAGPAKRVGGQPAVSAVVNATDPGGTRINVLLSAAQGRRRAWLVQVVSGPDRRGGRGLVEAQVALGTLVLRG
jgi:hypothetical protein